MTKREMFTAIANVAEVAANAEMVEFLNHQIELLDARKASGSKGMTSTQKANEVLKALIFDVLAEAGEPITIGTMLKDSRLAGLSNQKMSALLRQMVEANKVIKSKDKKTVLFEVAAETI